LDLANTQVIEILVKRLSRVREGKTDGAVALILRLINQKLEVLVVKRIENPSNPWSGQIGLPSGKRDAKDQNLKQTAHSRGTIRFSFGEFPAYLISDNVIWGLMFRSLESFIRKLDKA